MLKSLTKYNRSGGQCCEGLQFKVFEAKFWHLPRSHGLTKSTAANLHNGVNTILGGRGLPEPGRSVLNGWLWTKRNIYACIIIN